MSNYKPYFRHIKDMNMKLVLMFVVMLCVNTAISMVGTVQSAEYQSEVISFASQCSIFGGMICLGAGAFYSFSLFASTMSIKADRVGYLKATFLWGIILSVGLALFSYGFDMLCKAILEALTGMPVKIYSEMRWVQMERLQIATDIISRITGNLVIFSLALALGAIWYRLKVRTSILLFVVLPVTFTAYVVNFGIRNPEKIELLFGKISNMVVNLLENPALFTGIKCMGIVAFSVIGIMLLIKAPIKDYANDLL